VEADVISSRHSIANLFLDKNRANHEIIKLTGFGKEANYN
jgi:hypothetical protein